MISASAYGKITRMAEPALDPKLLLREDMSKEYYALLGAVSNYDGWLLIVKGWSVTLSLAALGLAIQQGHYSLFLLAAVSGAAFWLLDGLMKGFQYRYYVRMREIEYTAYLINAVAFDGEYGKQKTSAPRIDLTFGFKGFPGELKPGADERAELPRRAGRTARRLQADRPEEQRDLRVGKPLRRSSGRIYRDLQNRWWLTNVMIPHILAVCLGTTLFILFAALNASGIGHLHL